MIFFTIMAISNMRAWMLNVVSVFQNTSNIRWLERVQLLGQVGRQLGLLVLVQVLLLGRLQLVQVQGRPLVQGQLLHLQKGRLLLLRMVLQTLLVLLQLHVQPHLHKSSESASSCNRWLEMVLLQVLAVQQLVLLVLVQVLQPGRLRVQEQRPVRQIRRLQRNFLCIQWQLELLLHLLLALLIQLVLLQRLLRLQPRLRKSSVNVSCGIRWLVMQQRQVQVVQQQVLLALEQGLLLGLLQVQGLPRVQGQQQVLLHLLKGQLILLVLELPLLVLLQLHVLPHLHRSFESVFSCIH